MSRVLEVRFFGRAAVRWGETDLQLDARPRCVPLLAKLVLEAGSPVERRQVAGLLWPDDDEERARANLRRHLHWLLQRLPSREEPWIFADHGTLRWNERAPWRCDATELLAAVARGETDIDDIPAGDFLEGVDDSWTIGERSRLRTAMVEHLASAAIVARATGAADRAERLARRALPFEPFDERLVRTLMAALADQGRRSEALAVFSAHEHRCRTELDARPDDETSDFAKALRDGALPQPVPTNLTPPPVRFFGRARELTDVRGLLATRRLVTLTGPGGIGKTRLATEIALRELARQPDGVFLADLSSIADDASIVAAIASAVGAPLRVAGPEGLIAGIGRARMLLVLDNVEHVIGETSRIVERLLRGCPALRVLLTSREPLRSAGEVVRRLGPMLVPDEEAASTEEVRGSEAVRYFVERARDVDAGFALDRRSAAPVAMICRRLDGIPLALELAAARLGTTDARSLAASLERHCTLESTIAWSLDLLDEAHRAQAIDASVLPGSFDAELARAVLDENAPAFLVEHSLLHYEGGAHPRYRMLEPIRLVLAQRLAPQRETELRERYARAVIARTLRISPDLEGSRQTEAVNQVASDDHHVRSALVWCIEERHDTTAGLRLAGALSPYWIARSMFAEGVRWGEAALASADDVPSHERATVLQLIGSSSYYIRDFARAESAIRAALRAFETLGGAYGIARATHSLGV
ncbi:MAG: hypothetical protein JO101_11125, partial [Candidatus Eremiobacteraeota bacterium]|nr:hypothetical protein [Candidatus Eremiobacteraeota bacterium]